MRRPHQRGATAFLPAPPLLRACPSDACRCRAPRAAAAPGRRADAPPSAVRRSILSAAAASLLAPLRRALADTSPSAPPALREYKYADGGASFSYPVSWFLSEKPSGDVLVGALGALIVCVVHREVRLRVENDALEEAWAALRPREGEGIALFVKGASWEGAGGDRGACRFEFDSETTQNDGTVIVRRGIGRVLPGSDGERVSILLTAPKDGWLAVEGVCWSVLDSMRV
jgi:hypothetical protein